MSKDQPEPQSPEPVKPAANSPFLAASAAKARLAEEKGVWMQATLLPMALIGVYLVVIGLATNIYGAVAGTGSSPEKIFDTPLAPVSYTHLTLPTTPYV